MQPDPIDRLEFDAADLVRDHPPRWRHPHKELVHAIAHASEAPVEGRIGYARWRSVEPAGSVSHRPGFTIHPGVFRYEAGAAADEVVWHVNFADDDLFVAYGSRLLAQDELQVAEHPALGSVREAVLAKGRRPLTVEGGRPTPVTITGVQRRCAIDTFPNLEAGIPHGLYGNAFARASREQVEAATSALFPPTMTNLLAIAAPACGRGRYVRGEIDRILATAATGFAAARAESIRLAGGMPRVVIHTGFWGCGAFGGNRTLMTILQSLAADLVGVELSFWAYDEAGVDVAARGRELYEQVRDQHEDIEGLAGHLVDLGLEWGVSDGN